MLPGVVCARPSRRYDVTTGMAPGQYPVRFDVAYPEGGNRWMILVRWLLAVPHLVIIYVLNSLASVITLIAFFAILFTRSYPPGLFKIYAGIQRWTNNTWAYVLFHD